MFRTVLAAASVLSLIATAAIAVPANVEVVGSAMSPRSDNFSNAPRGPGPSQDVSCQLDRSGRVVLVNRGNTIEAGYKIIYRIGDGPAIKRPLRVNLESRAVLNTGQTAAAPLRCRARVVF